MVSNIEHEIFLETKKKILKVKTDYRTQENMAM